LSIFKLSVELGDGRIDAIDFRTERKSRIDLPGFGGL
jgi:hypothetical protein